MKKIMGTGLLLIAAALFFYGYQEQRQQKMTEEIAGKIIRFHVRANSDKEADQKLKLQVRDAVGAYLQPALSGVSDLEEGRAVIESRLTQIEQQAAQVIEREGFHYPVKAELAVTDFPEKTYGDYTFPAGKYEALEVEIGAGEGRNWWCVMYPNLCFFNSTYEVVEKEAEKSLERVLSQEEYKSLMEHKNYEVKSALVEWVKEKIG
ncbi:MAG: stage II sporulation protein R [Lachnospiraceae bacterium]|nr:stage II sporulation protein R [Lachnospiraceae bacterium]